MQGLRALAVLAVVAFHAGAPWLPSGYLAVDVFFVVSGFVVTASMLREVRRSGRFSYRAFLGRRARRLLPVATVVVATTLLGCVLVVPSASLHQIGTQGAASLLGLENVLLAADGVGYLTDSSTSPFVHFWSLGVEEQFYVLWPVVLLALLALARSRPRRAVALLGALCAVSFALAVWTTEEVQPWSFYLLPTRAWELGTGALVACVAHGRPVESRARRSVGWLAALCLLVSVVALDGRPHPSFATLLPVAATAVVLALPSGRKGSVQRALSHPVLTSVGDRSYSLYLWHWPALAVPALGLGRPLALPEAALALGGAALLTEVSYRMLEPKGNRRPRSTPARSTRRTTASVVTAATVLLASFATTLSPVRPTAALPHGIDSWDEVGPPLDALPASLPELYADGCHLERRDTVSPSCRFGDTSERAAAHVVLFGDSHAAQWFSPLEVTAGRTGVELSSLTKGACPAADVELVDTTLARPFTECEAWRADTLRRIAAETPELVIISSAGHLYETEVTGPFLTTWADGLRRTLQSIPDGTEVIVLGDTPYWQLDPVLCLSAPAWQHRSCTTSPPALERTVASLERRVALEEGAAYVPTVEWLCEERCETVVGHTFAYSDASHVSDAAARLLRPRLEEELLPWWPAAAPPASP